MRRWLLVAPILALLCACASGPAIADTVTATWDNPTMNTDGTAIPASGDGSLVSARIAWGTCTAPNVFGEEKGSITRPMPVATAVWNVPPGTWCVRVTVANTYGEQSDPSAVGVHIAPFTKPRPPVNLKLQRQPTQ